MSLSCTILSGVEDINIKQIPPSLILRGLQLRLQLKFIIVQSTIILRDLLQVILQSHHVGCAVIRDLLDGNVLGSHLLRLQLPIHDLRLQVVVLGTHTRHRLHEVIILALQFHLVPQLVIVERVVSI